MDKSLKVALWGGIEISVVYDVDVNNNPYILYAEMSNGCDVAHALTQFERDIIISKIDVARNFCDRRLLH